LILIDTVEEWERVKATFNESANYLRAALQFPPTGTFPNERHSIWKCHFIIIFNGKRFSSTRRLLRKTVALRYVDDKYSSPGSRRLSLSLSGANSRVIYFKCLSYSNEYDMQERFSSPFASTPLVGSRMEEKALWRIMKSEREIYSLCFRLTATNYGTARHRTALLSHIFRMLRERAVYGPCETATTLALTYNGTFEVESRKKNMCYSYFITAAHPRNRNIHYDPNIISQLWGWIKRR